MGTLIRAYASRLERERTWVVRRMTIGDGAAPKPDEPEPGAPSMHAAAADSSPAAALYEISSVAEPSANVRDRKSRRRLLLVATPALLYLLIAILGPIFVKYDSVATDTPSRLLPPLSRRVGGELAILGTDQLGRDVLAQTIQGARVSMLVGIVTVLIAGAFGLLLGILAGYRRGWVDTVVSRFTDMQLAFPSILLAILIAAVLGPSLLNVIITLAMTRWVFFARVARSTALATRSLDFVDASRVLGARPRWVLRHDILPATVTPMMILATLEFGAVIVSESALSFLGLGTPITLPSWGLSIANGRDYLDQAWWIATVPGIALAVLMLSIGRFGDRLRDYLDPNMRGTR